MKTLETLTKFYKGFQHFATMDLREDAITFKVGAQVHQSCDAARKRINEMSLPLTAKVTSYNTFVVEPLIAA